MAFIVSIIVSLAAYADFGFYTQIDEFDQKNIQSKIFRIYTPAGQYSSLPLSNKPVLMEGIESLLEQGDIDSIQYKTILFQVEYCEIKKIDPCLLFLDVVRGTAFTAGEKGTVWTAFHNINGAAINAIGALIQKHKTKEIEAVLQFMNQGKFPVYLLDEEGTILIEPKLDESNWARNLAFPYENIGEFYQGGTPSAESDFAKFFLPSLTVDPLPIANEFAFGDKVFLGGYPASTGGQKAKFGGLDSDGESFYFGRGMILDVPSFFQRHGHYSLQDEAQQLKRSRQLLTTADAQVGHSGSPFLNDQGEVIGIFVEYLPTWMPTPKTNTAFGPNFAYIHEVLESF